MSISPLAPKYRLVADELRDRIADGQWPEGFRLPSEAELTVEFGASRGTVRAALSSLRSEGLVTGGQGRQPVVGHAPQSQSFSSFMSFTQWARSIGRTPGQQTREVARRPADPQSANRLGLEPGAAVVQVVRLRYLDDVPVMLERTSFEPQTGRMLFDFDPDTGSIFRYLQDRGVDLSHGTHTIDAVAADELDAHLLNVPPGAPLLRERRVTTSARGEAIEYSDDRYIPELTNFTIENSSEQRASLVRMPNTDKKGGSNVE